MSSDPSIPKPPSAADLDQVSAEQGMLADEWAGNEPQVVDHPARNRFELPVADAVAFAAYTRAGTVLTVTHTEVPAALSGQGIGSALARGLLDIIRHRGERVMPRCAFLAAYIARHPAYADLVSTH